MKKHDYHLWSTIIDLQNRCEELMIDASRLYNNSFFKNLSGLYIFNTLGI